jgi:hypothetical protein
VLPVVFHHHAEIGAPLRILRQGGQAYATCAAPGQVRFVLRVILKEGGEIVDTVGEAMEAAVQSCP